jgi:hypothetical protein
LSHFFLRQGLTMYPRWPGICYVALAGLECWAGRLPRPALPFTSWIQVLGPAQSLNLALFSHPGFRPRSTTTGNCQLLGAPCWQLLAASAVASPPPPTCSAGIDLGEPNPVSLSHK